MDSVAIEDRRCRDESSDWGPFAMVTSSEETARVTFFCGHKADECNIQLSIGPRPMRTQMAAEVNDSCIPGEHNVGRENDSYLAHTAYLLLHGRSQKALYKYLFSIILLIQ